MSAKINPDGIFKIRRLRWHYFKCDVWQQWSADVPAGAYRIERIKPDEQDSKWEPWVLSYNFDELYDEGEIPCDSLADAKEKAWQDWLQRLSPALQEVNGKEDK